MEHNYRYLVSYTPVLDNLESQASLDDRSVKIRLPCIGTLRLYGVVFLSTGPGFNDLLLL